jgi:hypothetical protein
VELPLSVDIEHLLLTFDILNGDDPADRRKSVTQLVEITNNQGHTGAYLYLFPVFFGKSEKIKWQETAPNKCR